MFYTISHKTKQISSVSEICAFLHTRHFFEKCQITIFAKIMEFAKYAILLETDVRGQERRAKIFFLIFLRFLKNFDNM